MSGHPVPIGLRRQVETWLAGDPDPATRAELTRLLDDGNAAALEDRFRRPLGFGTAGLRGPLGAGPARMNRAVVRRTTVGLARWVLGRGRAAAEAGVVVGRDARHGSEAFAADVADVLTASGVVAHVLSRPLPTPITAFAVRHLEAAAGVMITASHNPAADNGYKVYAGDGAQVIPPDDGTIAAGADWGPAPSEWDAPVNAGGADGETLEAEFLDGETLEAERLDAEFLDAETLEAERLDAEFLDAEVLAAYRDAVVGLLEVGGPRALRLVYTPMHGVGGNVLPGLLAAAGFDPPTIVAEQAHPDPDFPTLPFPNPEEPGALDFALATARHAGADLVVANDPDADRLAVAVPDRGGRWRALTGDELGILLADRCLRTTSGPGRLVATTVVSSSMLSKLAAEAGVAYEETLTGFKWIARAAQHRPGHRLIFGYEEALGYTIGDVVADKDGLSAALVAAELAAGLRAEGLSLLDRLDELAARLGVHATDQWSVRAEGPGAAEAMAEVVATWRRDPPTQLGGLAVTEVVDLAVGVGGLPPSDAVIVRLGDRGRVVLRPSGTEPKLKAYLEITTDPPGAAGLADARRAARAQLAALRAAVAERTQVA